MREFDLAKAKAGYPVCTEDGRPAEILCYDFKRGEELLIVAKIGSNYNNDDTIWEYHQDGTSYLGTCNNWDLRLAPRKGWVNVYISNGKPIVGNGIYKTEDEAIQHVYCDETETYEGSVEITWGE